MKSDLYLLLASDESPVLEFKREWYWCNSTPKEDMQKKWGEFLKDLISLFNGYLGCVGKPRHLIFGFDESEKSIHSINLSEIKQLSNISNFKKIIDQKLEKLIHPSHLNYTIETIQHEDKTLLVFEISPPGYPIELKTELQTKTKFIDSGAVVLRKGQKSDEVRIATPSEFNNLVGELELFRKSQEYNIYNQDVVTEPKYKSIKKTIQSYIDRNSSYSISEGFPIIKKAWRDNVIYEIFRLKDDFSKVTEFIYIHDSSNQGKTYADIKNNGYVLNFSDAIILIDKPKIKDIDKRKENLKKVFNSEFIFFIDEFGYEFLYKDCILPYEKFDLPIFVDSFYKDESGINVSALDRVKEWFESENEPLFVISGHGGIGKTTIAKQFLDYVYDKNNNGVLFIDSKEIISELSRRFSLKNKICDVYDFYDALMGANDDSSRFNRELLKLSIDNGSLVIALDGIDEVIAKLGDKFDIEQFIKSIYEEYSSELNQTKILITCRDHFWTGVRKNINIPEIKISAFNEVLLLDFYDKKFNSDQKKIDKALNISNEFAIESEESSVNYIPFLVDIIARIVKSATFTELNKKKLNSEYLSSDHNVDLLVSLICEREVIKLGTFSVDEQVCFFMGMASEKNNGISVYDVKSILSSMGINCDNSMIENLKGHPLIEYARDRFIFRYDVFDNYFKSLQLVNYFNSGDINSLEPKIADIVTGYLKYDSSFTRTVSEKITISESSTLFFIENIESDKLIEFNCRELFISSIVVLCLDILLIDKTKTYNTETRTDLIDKIFSDSNGVINNLCMVDVFGNRNSKIIFDFRNRVLENCHFNNFQYFWECFMDQGTRFKKSFFNDLDPMEGLNYDVHSELFSSDCDISNIKHLINKKEREIESSFDQVSSDVLKAFKLFYQRGNFYPKKQVEIRKKLSTTTVLDSMINYGAISKYIDPKKPTMQQYRVSSEYKSVVEFIEQGVPSEEFELLVSNIVNGN